MKNRKFLSVTLLSIGVAAFLSACSSHSRNVGKGDGISRTTSWAHNDGSYGGYAVAENYRGQQTPRGMTLVQGGRFTMGANDDEMPTVENNSVRRTVSVSSFYMDETELANVDYREYMYWLGRAYYNDIPEVVAAALPDSTVWRSPLGYNEPYVKNYFRAAAYNNYPVVGVNWYQATDYCKWRTDRVNEYLLIQAGALTKNVNQTGEDVFTTESYQNGQYQGSGGQGAPDLDPNGAGTRPYGLADGIFMPDYRLPTEAEWEYAALGIVGNNPAPETKRRRGEEVFTDRNVVGWGPRNTTRYDLHNQYQGEIMGNFMRGKGDVMGVADALNDGADITSEVMSYQKNAWGLYNMAGNVNEWVMDTYRPGSSSDVDDFRSFRGNDYQRQVFQEDGTPEERDSTGHIPYMRTPANESAGQGRMVRTSNLHSYHDGVVDTSSAGAGALNYYGSYDYGKNSLINDSTKVYKGGSWADRAYYLSPGTRRYIQGNMSTNTIGFRCVVDRLGSPTGNNKPAGNNFGIEKARKR